MNRWLCEGSSKIEELTAEHEIAEIERHAPGAFAYIHDGDNVKCCRMLHLTLTVEVVAETVEEAYRIARQSLDPRLDVSIHTVRRV